MGRQGDGSIVFCKLFLQSLCLCPSTEDKGTVRVKGIVLSRSFLKIGKRPLVSLKDSSALRNISFSLHFYCIKLSFPCQYKNCFITIPFVSLKNTREHTGINTKEAAAICRSLLFARFTYPAFTIRFPLLFGRGNFSVTISLKLCQSSTALKAGFSFRFSSEIKA